MFVAVAIGITKSEQLVYWRDKLKNGRRKNCVSVTIKEETIG